MHVSWDPYDFSVLRFIDGYGATMRVSDVDDDTIELTDLTDDTKQQSRSDVTDFYRQLIYTQGPWVPMLDHESIRAESPPGQFGDCRSLDCCAHAPTMQRNA